MTSRHGFDLGFSDTEQPGIFWVSANFTITKQGIYIVDSAAAIRTVTLPTLASVSASGFRVIIKRLGANFVDVDAAGSDEYEVAGITSKRLFNDSSALSLVAHSQATDWLELGFYGGINPS